LTPNDPTPSFGQMEVNVAFKQRNTRPTTYAFGLGANWESSWLGYVKWSNNGSWNASAGPAYMPLGGERNYVGNGVTKEIKSASTMSTQYDGSGNLLSFTITNPNGSRMIFGYRINISASENYAFLSNEIDPVGHTNTFIYETLSGPLVRLIQVKDADGKYNYVRYVSGTSPLINEVENPYGAKATFSYDGSGKLTNIVNVGAMTNSFVYNAQGLPTNSVTPYGTTAFKTTTNAFTPYNLGGNNEVNRSVEITYPEGSKELFLYRDQSTKLNPSSGTDLLPAAYPGVEVPSTSPLSNSFDNSSIDARNSFHWGRKQYSGLSSGFTSSGNFNNLTSADYLLAQIKHWLRRPNDEAAVSPFLAHYRNASPDGTLAGQKTWFDYAGKNGSYPGSRGTNGSPSFVALVLPDGTNRFTYNERNNIWEKPTKTISTYSTPSGNATRTNTFTYTADAIDLVTARGPSNELLSSNAYNGFHQVVTNFNAVNEMTTYTYDTGHRLTSGTVPTGLIHNNNYAFDGCLTNSVDVGLSTNSFTYTNCLVLCHTDPFGLCTTNTWDGLLRQIKVAQTNGAINNTFQTLDLSTTVDKMGYTNRFTYK